MNAFRESLQESDTGQAFLRACMTGQQGNAPEGHATEGSHAGPCTLDFLGAFLKAPLHHGPALRIEGSASATAQSPRPPP